jgi:hypothetical protein
MRENGYFVIKDCCSVSVVLSNFQLTEDEFCFLLWADLNQISGGHVNMIFLVWLVLCYFVWPTVEILVTGSRTVSTTDDWMSLFFLLAMYWCYKVGKCESDTHNSEN